MHPTSQPQTGTRRRASARLVVVCSTLIGGWCASASGADMSEAAKREVGELLARIERSGCEFNRSGTWYDGATARKHLQRKYDYLAARHQMGSAEDFLSMAATKSSMSGQAYTIRCAGGAPVPSAQWLELELRRIRTTPAPSPR